MTKKHFTTSVDDRLLKDVKKLAIELDLKINDLFEEGMRHVLQRYGGQGGQIVAEPPAEYGRKKSGAGKVRKDAPSSQETGDGKNE